jgi:hypothetical protein
MAMEWRTGSGRRRVRVAIRNVGVACTACSFVALLFLTAISCCEPYMIRKCRSHLSGGLLIPRGSKRVPTNAPAQPSVGAGDEGLEAKGGRFVVAETKTLFACEWRCRRSCRREDQTGTAGDPHASRTAIFSGLLSCIIGVRAVASLISSLKLSVSSFNLLNFLCPEISLLTNPRDEKQNSK